MNYIFFTFPPNGTSSVSYKQWAFIWISRSVRSAVLAGVQKAYAFFSLWTSFAGIEYRIMLMNFCDVKLYRKKNKPTSFLLLISSKDADTGKDWGQAEKGAIEDEMAGWHHWFNGHEFEQTPEDGEGQGSVTSYSSWGCKELDHTEWLNNSNSQPKINSITSYLCILSEIAYTHISPYVFAWNEVKWKSLSCVRLFASPWTVQNPPGQSTGVGNRSLLQQTLPTQALNLGLLHCRWILYQLSHQGNPRILE